ncbi:phosphatase PAP2 family protein [Aestuariivirga sp.]|uniref:phosphatase PAP2 family protein n=1 Tax=Aestuariivirga sp. TaxID=2650926 RepID=UPI0039E41C96
MTNIAFPDLNDHLAGHMGARLKAIGNAVWFGVYSHGTLYLLAIATYCAGLAESAWLGAPLSLGLVGMLSGTTFAFLYLIISIWLAGDLVRLWWTGYRGSAVKAIKDRLLDDILAPERISNTLHSIVAVNILFVGFLTIKKNIPLAVPFAWDPALSSLDRVLHFGVLPHEILSPLLASPLAIFFLNLVYNFWFVVLTVFFFWQGFRKRDTLLRQRFLLSYMLTWVLGTCLLGTLLSSAGPCFYGLAVQGPDPYAGLLAELHHANTIYPVWAVPTQELLWQSYTSGHGDIEGVSAMPSMHVATAVLFLLCAIGSGIRWLVWFTAIFALLIFTGSVVLGWHYAVDGYAGAAIALIVWTLAGWWVKPQPLKPQAMRNFSNPPPPAI